METMRIEEFAKKYGKTDRAIRKHIQKYADELEGHVFPDPEKRGTLLDKEAQRIIKSKMNILPDEHIISNAVNEELEAENKQLAEVNQYQRMIIQLQAEKAVLLQQASELLALQASNDDLKQRLEEAESRAHNAEVSAEVQENAAAEAQRRAAEATERAEKAEKALSDTSDKNIALQTERDLEKKRREEAEAELDNLKKRGFWARLFNKE